MCQRVLTSLIAIMAILVVGWGTSEPNTLGETVYALARTGGRGT